METLPRQRSIFCFYGDDFTGSTDALDSLAHHGVPSVLYLHPPCDSELRAFPDCRAIGIAGDSRSRAPEWMRDNLPGIFARLRDIGAPIVQYKVCSTFDSSPEVGSIGCALDIGKEVFSVPYVPIVPAAPLLQRYVAFGHLFAAGDGAIHRIDRHPSMKQHPVTPMDESDLLVHLSRQTKRRLALVNVFALRANCFTFAANADAILFDGLDPADAVQSARLIWDHRRTAQMFVIGSSGFTNGLLEYWQEQGLLLKAAIPSVPKPADRLLVLAGSCSPTTERQIGFAVRDGFHSIRLNPLLVGSQVYDDSTVLQANEILKSGGSLILYSALGLRGRVDIADRSSLASAMGRILRRVIDCTGVRRVLIAGGDTASHAVQELGISALTFAAPLAPGAPLCRAHGGARELELVLKGGQVGSERFFEEVLA